MTIKRIQRQRTQGYRMPEGAKSVTRPGTWGNPFLVVETKDDPCLSPLAFRLALTSAKMAGCVSAGITCARFTNDAVAMFRIYAQERLKVEPHWLAPLRAATALACFCPISSVCHADVLCEMLNTEKENNG